MASALDLLRKEKQKIAARKGKENVAKLPAGDSKWRILPSWRGGDEEQFFHPFATHWIKAPPSQKHPKGEILAVYVCVDRTFEKDCEICNLIGRGIRNSNDDVVTKTLKETNATQRYLVNAVRTDGGNKAPVLLELPQSLFESLIGIADNMGEFHVKNGGYDLSFTKSGTGLSTTYSVVPTNNKWDVDDQILQNMTNIDEYVAQEHKAGLEKATNSVKSIAGMASLPPAAAISAPANGGSSAQPKSTLITKANDEIDMTSVEPVDTDDLNASAVTSSSQDDDVDSLLASLDDDLLDDIDHM